MIVNFGDRKTRAFFQGKRIPAFRSIEKQAARKLQELNAIASGRALSTPGSRLKTLKGKRKGQRSIRVNKQWRICFEWPRGKRGPTNVAILDYH